MDGDAKDGRGLPALAGAAVAAHVVLAARAVEPRHLLDVSAGVVDRDGFAHRGLGWLGTGVWRRVEMGAYGCLSLWFLVLVAGWLFFDADRNEGFDGLGVECLCLLLTGMSV